MSCEFSVVCVEVRDLVPYVLAQIAVEIVIWYRNWKLETQIFKTKDGCVNEMGVYGKIRGRVLFYSRIAGEKLRTT